MSPSFGNWLACDFKTSQLRPYSFASLAFARFAIVGTSCRNISSITFFCRFIKINFIIVAHSIICI
ncbi:hypothetical protein J2T15_002752 [Paenibacillus harenae]|uniref:Uncharacterized protein n=1 Tax=Paenibacillus harenae TaxID=306543 RepID=A0ABT9U0Z0_PAEHA|nr:hypothetical protein [Paenibacillus harenae]